jgi:hypothetical protein
VGVKLLVAFPHLRDHEIGLHEFLGILANFGSPVAIHQKHLKRSEEPWFVAGVKQNSAIRFD